MIQGNVEERYDGPAACGVAAACRAALPARVRLAHRTRYTYDRPVWLSPHEIRLRPAAHARCTIEDYAIVIQGCAHDLKWHPDPYGNWVAQVIFSQPSAALTIDVELVATLQEVNPFDFYVANDAWQFPFAYAEADRRALAPYLEVEAPGARLRGWLERMRARLLGSSIDTIELLVAINRWIADEIRYEKRPEPGIRTAEETLAAGSGSCRDSAVLLMEVLRHSGIAARFVSGYLVQLAPGEPAGGASDTLALHAWCEAYVPGAGWIGLDATSGLLTTEVHIPLACAAVPEGAAPVRGATGIARTSLEVEMGAVRLAPLARVAAAR